MWNFKRRLLTLLLTDLFSLCFTLFITGTILYSLIPYAVKALKTSIGKVAENLRGFIEGVASFQGQPVKMFTSAIPVFYLTSKPAGWRRPLEQLKLKSENPFTGEGNVFYVS